MEEISHHIEGKLNAKSLKNGQILTFWAVHYSESSSMFLWG
jgi:hypothetical protein